MVSPVYPKRSQRDVALPVTYAKALPGLEVMSAFAALTYACVPASMLVAWLPLPDASSHDVALCQLDDV